MNNNYNGNTPNNSYAPANGGYYNAPPSPQRAAIPRDAAYSSAVKSSSASVNLLLGLIFYLVSVVVLIVLAVLMISGKWSITTVASLGSIGILALASGSDVIIATIPLILFELPFATIFMTIGYIINVVSGRGGKPVMRGAGFTLQFVSCIFGTIVSALAVICAFTVIGNMPGLGLILLVLTALLFTYKLFMMISFKKIKLASAGIAKKPISIIPIVIQFIFAALLYVFGCLNIALWGTDILITILLVSLGASLFFSGLALLSCRKKLVILNSGNTVA